jgi:diguanylate cyclase (GGDEF)-like protein
MYMPYLMCGYAATVILMLAGCYAISRTVPGLRGLRLLVWALFCGLFGVSLLATRPFAPAWATILLANLAILSCSLLIYAATANILDAGEAFHPWGIAVLAIAFLLFCYFTYSHESLTSRIYIGSGCFAVFAGAKAALLFTFRQPVVEPVAPQSGLDPLIAALAWLQVAIVTLQVVRIILTVLYPPAGIVHMDIIQSGFTYLNLILNAGAGFGLVWLAQALHRRDLHRIAQTDSLTGLLNRRAFEEILTRELHRSNHLGKPLTILLVDIDRFKDVNDTFGHQAGDEVIRRVADALLNSLRPGDSLSRFGGEEFVILLRDATPTQSEEVAGRLRANIADLDDLPGRIRLTVSIGVAASQILEDPETLMRRCDEAMYKSKKGGRNLVTFDHSVSARTNAAPAEVSA